jgi:Gram-negative porin
MTFITFLKKIGLGLACLASLGPIALSAAIAAESGPSFSLSGFATLAAGKVLSGTHDPAVNQGYDCPCYISDYAQNSVYESKGVQLRPDSKLGLQGRLSSQDQKYSLTAQVVARGAADGRTNLEWLYATAELSNKLTLQVGRKRLPLFQHSDSQDIGHALNWIHLPPQMYGWEIVNYNGASLNYRETFGNWTTSFSGFLGQETANDSGFWKIYNGKSTQTRARWSKIVGAEAKASRDWFEVRAMYMQSDTQNQLVGTGTGYSDATKQKIFGVSLNADFGGPFASAEFLYINRDADYGGDRAQLYAVGYRLNKFTPLLSFANYQQRLNDKTAVPEAHRSVSAVLRYDLNSTTAIKAQYDMWTDKAGPGFGSMHGNSKVLTLSIDKVF